MTSTDGLPDPADLDEVPPEEPFAEEDLAGRLEDDDTRQPLLPESQLAPDDVEPPLPAEQFAPDDPEDT